jgi:hypothetical protein
MTVSQLVCVLQRHVMRGPGADRFRVFLDGTDVDRFTGGESARYNASYNGTAGPRPRRADPSGRALFRQLPALAEGLAMALKAANR